MEGREAYTNTMKSVHFSASPHSSTFSKD